MTQVWAYAAALIPFLGCAFIFYVIMKGVLESDRRERIAQAKWHAEHDAPAADSRTGAEEITPSQQAEGLTRPDSAHAGD